MSRRTLLLALLLAAAAWAKFKVIDLRTMPQKPAALAELLRSPKERDPVKRAAASLLLDSSLRDKGTELKATDDAEQVLTVLLEKAFQNMAAANDVYGWNKDENNPRADMLCKKLLVLPGRVSGAYHHKFHVTINAKKADPSIQGKECDTEVVVALSEKDFHSWVDNQGWGIIPYQVMTNEDGVTRGGFAFLSPGTASYPAPRFERPTYVGFAEKKDDAYKLVALEPALTSDWHKQEANIYLPEAPRPSEQEKRARLSMWMESVRGVDPMRQKFLGPESTIFLVNGLASDRFEKGDAVLFEKYLESDDLMVKAAAQLKYSSLGGGVTAAALGETMKALKSVPARSELGRAIFKLMGQNLDNGQDATKEDKAAIEKILNGPESPWPLGRVNWVKIYEDWAKVSVSNMPCSFFLMRQSGKDWVLLGPVL